MADATDEPAIVHTTLKDVGEGYRILTRGGLLPPVEWVDWDDERGKKAEATLEDLSTIRGRGRTRLATVWWENADVVTDTDLAAAPSIRFLKHTGKDA